MITNNLEKLAGLIKQERETLLASWREQVQQLPSAEHLVIPVLNDHIPSLLDELVAALKTGFDQTIPEAAIEASPPAHGLQRFADASLMRRVFQNLIANAIKYTPRGKVIIGARELPNENIVECWVRDNGAGIPEPQLERVFEELEPGAAEEGGLGLGLAIVKTFVEAHCGRVRVESKEGEGSEFRFTLPKRN